MLDLNKLKSKNYEFIWFDGSTLQLKRPSQKMFDKLMELSELKEADYKSLIKVIFDVLTEIINGNINGRKFTREEIEEEFDLSLAYIFIEDYTKYYVPQLGE